MKCLQFRKMAAIEDSLYSEEVLCDLNFTDLESYKKYGISCVSPGDGLKMRPLEKGDFDKGYIILLSQLTKVGEVDREKYEKQFDSMKKCPGTYYTTVIEDVTKGRIVCSATLLVERKFIHSAALRGRIEDVVVDEAYRSRHLGRLILETLTLLGRELGCYKLSLDCNPRLIDFYKKFGYSEGSALFLVKRFFD